MPGRKGKKKNGAAGGAAGAAGPGGSHFSVGAFGDEDDLEDKLADARSELAALGGSAGFGSASFYAYGNGQQRYNLMCEIAELEDRILQ